MRISYSSLHLSFIMRKKHVRYMYVIYDIQNSDLVKISKNTAVAELIIGSVTMDDEGAKILARSKSIKSLELYGTKITDEGAYALASNPRITRLFLHNNNITNKERIRKVFLATHNKKLVKTISNT